VAVFSDTPTRQTAISLLLDAAAAEVIGAMGEFAVPAMILKGPAVVNRLYGDGSMRPYVDVDVLVPAERVKEAGDVLRDLGFEYSLAGARSVEQQGIEQCWTRASDGVMLDLHTGFHGVAPELAWDALAGDSHLTEVGGLPMPVPADGALALIIALHAAANPVGSTRSEDDLHRAATTFGPEVWDDALRRAERTGSVEWMSAGLRRTDSGSIVAERLGLPPARDVEIVVQGYLGDDPALSGAIGGVYLARLSKTRGIRARLRYVATLLFPSPSKLRASRGRRLPLLLGYPRHWWRALRAVRKGLPLYRRAKGNG
jgi:hypothetical protein